VLGIIEAVQTEQGFSGESVAGDLSSGTFGQGTCLTPFGLGEPKSRVMSFGLRYAF
jgi:hypothetical protein